MDGLSRRRAILDIALAGAGGLLSGTGVLAAQAPQPATKVSFSVPDRACDCHVHVFGDAQRYPFAPNRGYTPETASITDLRRSLDALQMDRVVIVQPSVYGTDSRCTLDAIRELGNRARGVAVIDTSTSDAALDEMERAGIRGIRLNLAQAGVTDPEAALGAFRTAVERVRARSWHIQLNASLRVLGAMGEQLLRSPVPLVVDHFGGAQAAAGVQQPGFAELMALVKSGNTYVKISGAGDLVSAQAPEYADVAPLAKALVAVNPQRILWGSNWPHPDSRTLPGRKNTDIAPFMPTDDGRILNLLAAWVPDAAIRRTILVDNPARLYRF